MSDKNLSPVLDFAIAKAAQHRVSWLLFLPAGKAEYTAREIMNAIGAALTAAGVKNNFSKAES